MVASRHTVKHHKTKDASVGGVILIPHGDPDNTHTSCFDYSAHDPAGEHTAKGAAGDHCSDTVMLGQTIPGSLPRRTGFRRPRS